MFEIVELVPFGSGKNNIKPETRKIIAMFNKYQTLSGGDMGVQSEQFGFSGFITHLENDFFNTSIIEISYNSKMIVKFRREFIHLEDQGTSVQFSQEIHDSDLANLYLFYDKLTG